jgi:hypothetical protein
VSIDHSKAHAFVGAARLVLLVQLTHVAPVEKFTLLGLAPQIVKQKVTKHKVTDAE